MKDELIAGMATVAGSSLGSITVATVPVVVTTTTYAGGIAGWLGFTTVATTVMAAPITVPVGGIVAAGALLTYGGYKHIKSQECQS
ncbi:MAG: hypothetical protein HWQ35_01045 [Nostoc sp. NMS1]|uniref:hypothetical protein n=1 Tax=Nostoc sp. NMS1 TaxID=2815388 RepID=UPI0025CC5201|nr:hypothetical protein [Nostoc sp. NMS1]MBN3905210.1 hypothetical protein [Nostoc sp. NMS1]